MSGKALNGGEQSNWNANRVVSGGIFDQDEGCAG